jgi:hypothetical protein
MLPLRLPATLFLAHAHADHESIEALHDALRPSRTKLDIFFDPNWDKKSVSPAIVPRIRAAGGLIFLDSPRSAASGWAFFEREYALLCKKPIFQFHHATGKITRWKSKPLDHAVFPSYSRNDQEQLATYLRMLKDRFFDSWSDESLPIGSKLQNELTNAIESRIERGGYFLYFCTAKTAKSQWCAAELRHALQRFGAQNRIIAVLVDNARLPVEVSDTFDLRPTADKSSEWLIDDLIILLYRKVAENTREPAHLTKR